MRKNLITIYSKDFKTPETSVMETLRNFVLCCGKVLIHKSTWITGTIQRNFFMRKEGILQQKESK